jgi:hypothetical protein
VLTLAQNVLRALPTRIKVARKSCLGDDVTEAADHPVMKADIIISVCCSRQDTGHRQLDGAITQVSEPLAKKLQ